MTISQLCSGQAPSVCRSASDLPSGAIAAMLRPLAFPRDPVRSPASELPLQDTLMRLMTPEQQRQWGTLPARVRDLLQDNPLLSERRRPFDESAFRMLLAAGDRVREALAHTSGAGLRAVVNSAYHEQVSDASALRGILQSFDLPDDSRESLLVSISDWERAPTADHAGALYVALMTVPCADPEDVLSRMALRVRSSGLNAQREAFRGQLQASLDQLLQRPGDQRSYDAGLEVGAALGLFGVEGGGAGLKLHWNGTIGLDDKGAVSFSSKGSAGLAIEVGLKAGGTTVVHLGGELDGMLKDKLSFYSTADFAAYCADSCIAVLARQNCMSVLDLPYTFQSLMGMRRSHAASDLEAVVQRESAGLSAALGRQSVLSPGEVLVSPGVAPILPKQVRYLGGAVQADVGMGLIDVGFSASVVRSETVKHPDALKAWKQDPASMPARVARTVLFRFPGVESMRLFHGEVAFAWLGAELACAEKDREMGPDASRGALFRQRLQSAMRNLQVEFKLYQQMVAAERQRPEVDIPWNRFSEWLAPSTGKQRAATFRARFETERQVRGEAEYLTSVLGSYAILAHAYKTSQQVDGLSDRDEPAFAALQSEMEASFRHPDFGWSTKETAMRTSSPVASHGTAYMLQGTVKVNFPALNIPVIGTGVGLPVNNSVEASVAYSRLGNQQNPDDDGEYLNIELGVMTGCDLNPVLCAVGSFLNRDLSQGVLASSHSDMALAVGGTIKLAYAQALDGEYHLQYTRAERTLKSESSKSLLLGSVKIGGEYGSSRTRVLKESWGGDTIGYVQYLFNAAKNRHAESAWRSSLCEHVPELCAILEQAARKPGSLVALEIDKLASSVESGNKLKALLIQSADRLLKSLETATDPLDLEHLYLAFNALEDLFEAGYVLHQQETGRRFAPIGLSS